MATVLKILLSFGSNLTFRIATGHKRLCSLLVLLGNVLVKKEFYICNTHENIAKKKKKSKTKERKEKVFIGPPRQVIQPARRLM